jgi:hypothetical protein
LFSDNYGSKEREAAEEGGESGALVEGDAGGVVYFEGVGEMEDAGVDVVVTVREDCDLVTSHHEALCELVDVILYTTSIGVEEIGHHKDVELRI